MSVARLKAWMEAIRGDVITNAQAIRIGGNLYAMTANPDNNLTNDQKAAAVLDLLRLRARQLVRDGAASIISATLPQSNIDAIKAAMDAAGSDV